MPPIPRDLAPRLLALAQRFPVVILTGPRQCGKTTLCQTLFPKLPRVSLESRRAAALAREDPRGFLAQFPQGAILDGVQNCPGLISKLSEAIVRAAKPGRWILTTAQAWDAPTAKSMAGRVAVLRMLPLSRAEVVRFKGHPLTLNETLLTGGYPGILAQRLPPAEWLAVHATTGLDVRQPSSGGNLVAFRRFLRRCAEGVGQALDISVLATDCGVTKALAKSWLSRLESEFIVFRLPVYSRCHSRRGAGSAALYFYDSGLVCWLLGLRDAGQLAAHPLKRAIFESWILAEILKTRYSQGKTNGLYHFPDGELPQAGGRAVTASDMMANLDAISHRFSWQPCKVSRVIVHDGAERQTRNGIEYLPWHAIQEYGWAN